MTALVGMVVLTLGATNGYAERDYSFMSQAGPPAAYSHETGFFARGSFGFGYQKSNFIADGEDVGSVKGFAIDWQAALGGIVAPNVGVHATFWGQTIPGPEFELNGFGSSSPEDTRVSLFGLGAGVTGYFGYSGLFLTGSLGAAKLRTSTSNAFIDDRETFNSDWGFAFDVMSGKEWMVADGVGIGVGLGGGMHIIPDESESKLQGFNLGVRMFLTLN
jgi:hypothetical protein